MIGIAIVVVAIAGGKLKLPGAETHVVESRGVRSALFLFGLVLLVCSHWRDLRDAVTPSIQITANHHPNPTTPSLPNDQSPQQTQNPPSTKPQTKPNKQVAHSRPSSGRPSVEAPPPANPGSPTCIAQPGSICQSGGYMDHPTVNNNVPPPPAVSFHPEDDYDWGKYDVRLQNLPGLASVAVTVQDYFANPAFLVTCSASCKILIVERGHYSPNGLWWSNFPEENQFFQGNTANEMGVTVGQGSLPRGALIRIIVQGLGGAAVSVLNVKAVRPPTEGPA